MMNEKVTVSTTTEALTSLESIVQDPAKVGQVLDGFCQNKITNLRIYKYPQFGETSSIFGMLFHHEVLQKSFQMIVELSSVECIITAIIENNDEFSSEGMAQADIQFTTEPGSVFSNEMMTLLQSLPVYEKQATVLQTMHNWDEYLAFLIDQYEYPFTLKSIEQISNRVYVVSLFAEDRVDAIEFTDGMSLFIQEGFQFKKIATISSEQSTNDLIEVTSDLDLMGWADREVYLFDEIDLKEIKVLKSELINLKKTENEAPSISHPLLNVFYPRNTNYSGITTREEDYENGVKSLFSNNEFDEVYSEVLLESHEIEKEIALDKIVQLPQLRNGDLSGAIEFVKKPLLEKSMIKHKELENILCDDEMKIQQKSLLYFNSKINKGENRVEAIHSVEEYLHGFISANEQKVSELEERIEQFKTEQQKLVKKNENLVSEYDEIQKSLNEQEEKLAMMKTEKTKDTDYYKNLEENWLVFNRESASYNENIMNKRDIKKAHEIIEECEGKISEFNAESKRAKHITQKMKEELELFKTNQQIEKVEDLVHSMKRTAEYLDVPIDLQFASSYTELMRIYMEKFEELERVESEILQYESQINNELSKADLDKVSIQSTDQQYDRREAEERIQVVVELIEKKPLSLGLNYKAKTRWKEQFNKAYVDLEHMKCSILFEKKILEEKLMTQLNYSEQMQGHFEGDVTMMSDLMEDVQRNLELSAKEYIDIISTAKNDIEEMEKNVKITVNSTGGRGEQFTTIQQLELARKEYKKELLEKYDALENLAVSIENTTKYIDVLSKQLSIKSTDVENDRVEMTAQLQILDHDTTNTQKNIQELIEMNQLSENQIAELHKQVEVHRTEISKYQQMKNNVNENVAFKTDIKMETEKSLKEVNIWHDKLTNPKFNNEWEEYIVEKSKLKFVNELKDIKSTHVVLEDRDFTWLEMLIFTSVPRQLKFISSNISERTLPFQSQFERYLMNKGMSILRRQEAVSQLKQNPFNRFSQVYEHQNKPYVIADNEEKMSM